METMRASAWMKIPRNQPGDGGRQASGEKPGGWDGEDGQVGKKRESVCCASRCVGFWVYRVVTDCHRFDRLRFAL